MRCKAITSSPMALQMIRVRKRLNGRSNKPSSPYAAMISKVSVQPRVQRSLDTSQSGSFDGSAVYSMYLNQNCRCSKKIVAAYGLSQILTDFGFFDLSSVTLESEADKVAPINFESFTSLSGNVQSLGFGEILLHINFRKVDRSSYSASFKFCCTIFALMKKIRHQQFNRRNFKSLFQHNPNRFFVIKLGVKA